MSDKNRILISVIALALAFATGRYTVQSPTIKATVHQVEDTNTQTAEKEHKKIVIVEKAGEKTTTITDDVDTSIKQDRHDDVKSVETITPPKTGTLNLSALAGVDSLNRFKPIYGAAVTKQVLGPITIGAFGMSNSVVGLSVGITF